MVLAQFEEAFGGSVFGKQFWCGGLFSSWLLCCEVQECQAGLVLMAFYQVEMQSGKTCAPFSSVIAETADGSDLVVTLIEGSLESITVSDYFLP